MFRKRKKKYKYLPIEYYVAIFIGAFIGFMFPSYFHITSKVFLYFSIVFFVSFAYMYVLCFKLLRREYLIKEDDKENNEKNN